MRTHVRPHLILLLIACLVFVVQPRAAQAGTLTVDITGDENDPTCAPGDCSLREAIAAAGPGDTILFSPALSGQTILLTLGELYIDNDKNLVIDGSSLAAHVKISGDNASRVFEIRNAAVVSLWSLDILDGYVAGGDGGGGIVNFGDLTLTGCNVTGNETTGNGGGIHNFGSLAIEAGSTVARNSGDYGGGIRNDGTLTIADSSVTDNSANWGGGIDNYAGSMTMTATTVERNTAVYNGGGLTTGTEATIEDSAFRDNTAGAGGGIDSHMPDVTLTLTGCSLAGNRANGDGGGMINDEARVIATRCTFDANQAAVSGGALLNGTAGSATIEDSAFTNNNASSTNEGYGGAIENNGGLELNRDTFTANDAHWNGGAIENASGEVQATGCTFSLNQAPAGAAVNNNFGGSMTVERSTFDSNIASGAGGAFYNDNESELEILNSTLSANHADNQGGGIYNPWGTLTLSNATLDGNTAGTGTGVHNGSTLNYQNTIINGTAGSDCVNDGTIGANTNNLVADGSCSALLSGDALLGPLLDNGGPTETHALSADSPALDAGHPGLFLATDQREVLRPIDGDDDGTATSDIGAFERGHMLCGIQAAAEPEDYYFPGGVMVRVTDDGNDLDCLLVTEFPVNNPLATPLLRTGAYWQIQPLAADGVSVASPNYVVDLTLPYSWAGADDSLCRLKDASWDCGATSFVEEVSVTRTDIGELSEWAVSSGACESPSTPTLEIAFVATESKVLRLSWADDAANAGGYQVHRSTLPYFEPAKGTLLASVPPGGMMFRDAGGAGTAGTSYAYVVRGVGSCGEASGIDGRVGVFTFGLVAGS